VLGKSVQLKPQFTDDPGWLHPNCSFALLPSRFHPFLVDARDSQGSFSLAEPVRGSGRSFRKLGRCAAAGVLWEHAGAAYPFLYGGAMAFFSSLLLAVV
jgi:hypothetical protein